MPSNHVLFVVLIVLVNMAGCTAVPSVDTAAEAEAIRELSRAWNEAVIAKDIDVAAAYFMADGIQMAQNSQPLVGHEAIRQWFETWLPDPNITNSFKADLIEVAASGEIAYERGTYQFAIETEAGRIEDAGKYLCIWKKIDGEWKVAVDISNSDMPPAGE